MQHFELVTYLVVKTYKKGFKENLIEALKLYFKDKNDFEFPTKSKMIAFLEFSDNQGVEAKIKSKNFEIE